jgi:adenine-specific DNA-methyltransferase
MSLKEVRKYLGKPAYESDDVLIYSKDCLQGMKTIGTQFIDLTVTSPPYNFGKEYEEIVNNSTYIDWCVSWISEIHRITKENGTFWLNLGYFKVEGKGTAVPIPYLLWDKTDFHLIQEVVWNYAAGVACKNRFSPRNEKLLWYVKNPENYVFNLDDVRDPNVKYPNQKKNGRSKVNPIGKNPSDVWQISKVTSGANRSSAERTAHPAQFPIEMIDRLIKSSSNVGDIVLDPFMGSGTTALSALNNKRKVVGFELNDDYLDIIINRIESRSPQLDI